MHPTVPARPCEIYPRVQASTQRIAVSVTTAIRSGAGFGPRLDALSEAPGAQEAPDDDQVAATRSQQTEHAEQAVRRYADDARAAGGREQDRRPDDQRAHHQAERDAV